MNRICPKCGKTIEYKTEHAQRLAVIRNSLCGSCAREIRFQDPKEREKISMAVRGCRNPFWSKKHSLETIAKLSSINTGKELSEATKQKMSDGRRKENNANWKGDFLKCRCETCGVEFQSSDGRAKYCIKHRVESVSGEKNCNWNGGKILVTLNCKCCNKEFIVTTTQMRVGRKYCSHACSNIEKNKHNKMFDTDIEVAVQEYLTKNGMDFKKQVPLHGVTLADFVVGNMIIQCDGVYWHSRAGYVERDKHQDEKLVLMGYKVIRISDKEIKQEGVDLAMQRKMKSIVNNSIVSWR